MKTYVRVIALLGAIALGLVGCGSPPPSSGDGQGGGQNDNGAADGSKKGVAKDFKACMVSDSGGFDDKSFNQTSYKGLQDAVDKLGIAKAQAESKSDNDYSTNVNAMVAQDCDIIVTVGYKLADVTYAAAKDNPDINFAIVDNQYDPKKNPPLPNLKTLIFNTAQSSFLAGYLAAGMTESGKVGTFGGLNIPTVSIFMDGFAEGVQYYNKNKGSDVTVLGWNEQRQKGTFTGDFESKSKGQNTADNLISQGVDIIFPVAGPSGLGALQAAKATGGKVHAIWVDTDGCVSAAGYCDLLLTSVAKGMDLAVEKAITGASKGKFDNTPYVGTLENGGTDIAPYHTWKSKIPSGLKDEIDQLRKDLISGKIEVKSKAQPKTG